VSAGTQARPDSAGDGVVVVFLQGSLSAFFDGTAGVGHVGAAGGGVSGSFGCRGAKGTACNLTGTLTAARASAVLGSAKLSLHTGQTKKLRIALNASGRRLRRQHGHLQLVLTVTQRSFAGAVVTIKRQKLVV
jgi:hypothetical protein